MLQARNGLRLRHWVRAKFPQPSGPRRDPQRRKRAWRIGPGSRATRRGPWAQAAAPGAAACSSISRPVGVRGELALAAREAKLAEADELLRRLVPQSQAQCPHTRRQTHRFDVAE